MALRVPETEIRQRFIEWRNLKQLQVKARLRIAKLVAQLKEERRQKAELKQLLQAQAATINQLQNALADKEAQRKELIGYLYKETKQQEDEQKPRKPRDHTYHRSVPLEADITEKQSFVLTRCPTCRSSVGEAVDTVVKYEEDIDLAPRKIVKQYTITRHWCQTCEMFVKSREVPPIQRIGLNVLGYILYSRYRLRLPLNKIQESLRDLHDFAISEGEIVEKLKEAKELFGNDYDAIVELVKTAKVVYADETGWRMNGENWWLWVFVTKDGVRYLLEHGRGGGVPKAALGEKTDRVIVSDGYAAYATLPGEHQQCWVHLLRKAKQAHPPLYADLVALYLRLGEELTKPVSQRDPPWFQKQLTFVKKKHYRTHAAKKVQKRIQNHENQLFTCLKHAGVLPENNTAERAIRPQVVMRKIFGGSRSPAGARVHEVNSSVIETKLKQQSQAGFFEVVLPLLSQRRSEL